MSSEKNYKVVRGGCGSRKYTVIHNPERGTMTENAARRKARRLNRPKRHCSI
jgi:hypothetical protein